MPLLAPFVVRINTGKPSSLVKLRRPCERWDNQISRRLTTCLTSHLPGGLIATYKVILFNHGIDRVDGSEFFGF